ncbi:MAG: hypothetical protein ACOYNF_01210 [Rhodoferax sp.]
MVVKKFVAGQTDCRWPAARCPLATGTAAGVRCTRIRATACHQDGQFSGAWFGSHQKIKIIKNKHLAIICEVLSVSAAAKWVWWCCIGLVDWNLTLMESTFK